MERKKERAGEPVEFITQSSSVQVQPFLAEPEPAPPGSVQPPGEPKPEPQGPGSDRVRTAVQAKNIEYLC